ncbi:MAG: hypothetical protein AAFO82_06115 [Bacteroidota bacterium]
MPNKKNREGLFWASYTDLMTSLFFVMLVLYVLTYVLLEKQKVKIQADADRYQQILNVEKAVQNLEENGDFEYEEEYKRLILTRQIQFETNSYRIPPNDRWYLKKVGREIRDLVNQKVDSSEVRYLIIIEGMSSKDNAQVEFNYDLSYKRAYELYEFWTDYAGIEFDPKTSEIIIAGSGVGGVGRSKIERKNQRFLIQIIPKITAKGK